MVGGSNTVGGSKGKTRVKLIASVTSVAGVLLVCVCLGLVFMRKKKKKQQQQQKQEDEILRKQGMMIYEYLQHYE